MIETRLEHFYACDIPSIIFDKLSQEYGNTIVKSRTVKGEGGRIKIKVIRWSADFLWNKKQKSVHKNLEGLICLHTLNNGNISFYFASKDALPLIRGADFSKFFEKSLIRVFWKTSSNMDEMNEVYMMFPEGRIKSVPDEGHMISRVISLFLNAKADSRFSTFEKNTRRKIGKQRSGRGNR